MKVFLPSMAGRVVFGLLAFQLLFGQETRRSVQDIERQWKEYTSFQKHELISFCDFLFDQGYYERAILTGFRFVFLYPEDDRIPAVYYWIARSYEETGNYDLAVEYYRQVQSEVDPASTESLFPGTGSPT
ncbi:MAG: tol-pal system YbgF family protein [Fidelibacterota bacterium]